VKTDIWILSSFYHDGEQRWCGRHGKMILQCTSAMPDFIIAENQVIIRKSPAQFQNTLLIGDSASLLETKMLFHEFRKANSVN
jgi:hypothetical protein